jgi:RNA polymerase sigma-70 factor (ECF subfamily)
MERFDDKTPTATAPIGAVAPVVRRPNRSVGGGPVGGRPVGESPVGCGPVGGGSLGCSPVGFLHRPTARLSDDALMALVAEGDPRAFALLYERHVRAAVVLASQMCARRAIAEEVVQEAFLSFWRSRRRFDRSRGSVRGWVLGIVRNRAIDVLRQSVALRVADESDRSLDDLLQARELTDGEVGRREQARELRLALEGLPPEQSCVIELAYYGGYTHTEIATMLDTPIGTVKGRMRLGLRKMAVSVPAAI